MLNILFPTDFSDHAQIGLKFAIELCNKTSAQLHIISTFQVQRATSSFISMDEIIRKNTEEDMTSLLRLLSQFIMHDMVPQSKVIEGDAADTIVSYANRHDIDLIIMGTQGSNSLKTVLFGSVTKKVASKSKVPVMAVPMSVIPKNLNSGKFILAVDNQEIKESGGIDLISDLMEKLDKKMDILHVSNDQNKSEFPYDPFLGNYLGDQMGELILIEGENPVDAIKSYVEKNKVSLLVMIRREHSFLERLLIKGNTGQEILITNVPLMILPE